MDDETKQKVIPMAILYKLITDRNDTLSKKDDKLEVIKEELAQADEDMADLLEELDDKQQEIEEELLDKVQTPAPMSMFLRNILLIENLFNTYYSDDLRSQQQEGRGLAEGINDMEKVKVKLEYDADTFGGIYAAAKRQMPIFDTFCGNLTKALAKEGIKLKYPAKANLKKAPRSFYKAYFWYTGDKSHNKLSDLLRTSLVFSSFKDLYSAYNIIKKRCKVVRVKDRFNLKSVPFGYRDCNLNVRCPGVKNETPLICEVQLHHKAFYDNKKDSHKIYKLARLFEAKDPKTKKKSNFAYNSAKQFYAASVGNALYEKSMDFDQAEDEEVDEELLQWLEYAKQRVDEGATIEELMEEFAAGEFELYDDFDDEEDWDSDFDDDEEFDDEPGDDDYESFDDDYGDGDDEKDYGDDEDGGDDDDGDDDDYDD